MARLSHAQVMTRERILAAARTALVPDRFARQVIEALAVGVPFDDARFFLLDAHSRLINRFLYASQTDGPHRKQWMESIYLANIDLVPYFAPHVLLDQGVQIVTYRPTQDVSLGLPDNLLAHVDPTTHWHIFHETETPRGGTLRILLNYRNQAVGMIDCMRRRAERPFSPGEYTFLRSLIRPISEGLSRALSYEQAVSVDLNSANQPGPGIIIVGNRGHALYRSREANIWLEEILATDYRPGSQLPAAAWAAMARYRADKTSGAPRVRVWTRIGPATIEACGGQDDEEIVLLISPVQDHVSGIPDSWPLTRAERAIVQLVVKGHRSKDIAAHLSIAESTVEAHLGHVYEKMGIHRRGELLAKLVHEP